MYFRCHHPADFCIRPDGDRLALPDAEVSADSIVVVLAYIMDRHGIYSDQPGGAFVVVGKGAQGERRVQ